MSALLTVENLSVELPPGADRTHALEQVSFELHRGEILCMVGESGSGKSMSAGAILGLLPERVRVSSGRTLWTDETGAQPPVNLQSLTERELRTWRGARIGMIFQEPMTALNPLRTIGAQIAEVFRAHTRLSRKAIRTKTLELLEQVRIPDPAFAAKRYPHQLSGGQRQRAMIAMAMSLEPALLIADEPTTALDVTTQAQILHLIRDLQRRTGTAVLFITHDFGVVAEIADRVAVMRYGRIVESGSADAVLNAPTHAYTRALIAAVPSLTPAMQTADASGQRSAERVILSVSGVNKTYRQRHRPVGMKHHATHALRDVSLDLVKGATLGVVGESGSGKSTLARTIMRLVSQDSGQINFDGVDIAGLSGTAERAHRKKIQMVFQDPFSSLNPRRRVGDIVSQGPIAYGASPQAALAKARELFTLVGLAPDSLQRFPHEFSGGQRQRIGLARALALDPQILVADEPVSALDVSVQAQVLALLARLKSELGLSIIFITHDLRVAAQLCDHIAVMKDGSVVEYGAPEAIFGAPRHSYTQQLIASVPGRHWEPHCIH
jgi:peptide/nickel transport system ATP-binding protein